MGGEAWRAWCRATCRVVAAVLLGLAALVIVQSPIAPAAAVDPACQVSGPVSGAYTVTVCLNTPLDGAVLTGDTTVTASVTVAGTSPGIQRTAFFLDGTSLLVDYQAPFTFTLPTQKFVDGSPTLSVSATMRDAFITAPAAAVVTFTNGNAQPPVNTNTFTEPSGTTPAPGEPFVLAAVGDGADGAANANAVTDLIASWNPNLFSYLGDVYEDGTATEFTNWYGDGTTAYSRFKSITAPTIGNHEYEGLSAPGYFDYWDNVPHYYSLDVAGWHFISLDSTSQFNQTAPGTPQYDWLVGDLQSNTAPCTVVNFHHPVYNVGPEQPTPRMDQIWSLLASNGVDLVLTGHDHDYQRWAALDGTGAPSPAGMTQFVVGTGGHGIQQFITTDARMVRGFDTSPQAFGALRLELNSAGAAFRFVNIAGATLDAGSVQCNGTPADTEAPASPLDVSATAAAPNKVNVAWSTPIDNVGVVGYDIYRNGELLGSTGATPAYTDNTAVAEITYSYQVQARDAAGNTSVLSSAATVTTPSGQTGLFVDDFETGDFSKWNANLGLVAQQQEVYSGDWAARGTTTSAAAWSWCQLPSSYTTVYYRTRFKIVSQASNVYVLKFRTPTGGSILGVYVGSNGRLAYRNDVAGVTTTSTTTVTPNQWHTLQVGVVISGASSTTQTWLDEVPVAELSKTENLGTTPVGRGQLGDNNTGRNYDIAFDSVVINDSFVISDASPPTTPPDATATPISLGRVDLSWGASSDNVGVTGYTVYRDGVLLAGLPAGTLSYSDTTVQPETTYTYTVDAFDGAGNHSPPSPPLVVTAPGDTDPPSVPTGLRVTGLGPTEVDLAWNASTDNVRVLGYNVYRDGVLLSPGDDEIVTGTTFADTTVVPGASYAYTVAAFDEAGNLSAPSAPLPVSTTPDTTPPGTPANVAASATGMTSAHVTWDAATDDIAMAGYTVYRNGNAVASLDAATLAYDDTGLSPNTSYDYAVDAVDAAGNHSPVSASVPVTTHPDVSGPTTPTNVVATATGTTTVNLSWGAATDNIGVAGYTVTRDGSVVTTVAPGVLTFTDTGRAPNTTYSYTVDAFDAAGNHSAASAAATATTYLFADGFESGNLSNWTGVTSLTVQNQSVRTGVYAARATGRSSPAWAYRDLGSTQTDLYVRTAVRIVKNSGTTNLLKLRSATGAPIFTVYVNGNNKLFTRNEVTGTSTGSTTSLPNAWRVLELHAAIGTSGQIEVWVDGVKITTLSKTDNLGTTPIGRVQVGEDANAKSYTVDYDDVIVSRSRPG